MKKRDWVLLALDADSLFILAGVLCLLGDLPKTAWFLIGLAFGSLLMRVAHRLGIL